MTHILSWEARENGALALLCGSRWTLLSAYDLFADEYGNTWASSRSDKKRPGALNKATGLSHSAIAGTDGARQFLVDHGAIEPVDDDLMKKMYANKKNKPPVNAVVWHITCVVKQCGKAECTCSKLLQTEQVSLYQIATSSNFEHEVKYSSTTEVKDKKTGDKSPKPRPADPLFDAIVEVCKVNPKIDGSYIGKTKRSLGEMGKTAEDVLRFGKWWLENDWRGQKGQAPTLNQLVTDIEKSIPVPTPPIKLVKSSPYGDVPEMTPEEKERVLKLRLHSNSEVSNAA